MSGSKINNFSIGDSNIQSVMLTLDKAYKGLHQVSLTNYNNTSASQIAAGSVVENNGALYQFTSNESITGSPSNGTVYIRLVPNGDIITAEYTKIKPTWSDSKQGWYGTGGDANKRYLEFYLIKESAAWHNKTILERVNSRSYVRAYASVKQIVLSAAAVVNLTEKTDVNSEFTANTFTARKPGYYLANSSVFSENTVMAANGNVQFLFYVNGAQRAMLSVFPRATGFYRHSGSTIVFLDTGDYIDLRILQSGGNATVIHNGSQDTFMEIIEL